MRFVVFILLVLNTLWADQSILTKKEQDWIKNNTLKVGITDLYPLSYLTKDYQRAGFANDILALIIKKFQIKNRTIDIDQGNIEFAFENGEIDLIPLVNNTKVENDIGVYSSEILEIKRVLFVKKEQNNINSIDDLKHKKVAIINHAGNISHISTKYPNIKLIETKSMEESVSLLLEGNVEALISSPIIVQKYLEDNLLIGLKAMPLIIFEPTNLYYLTKKGETELQSIIEKGLNQITIKERKELFDKWFLKDLAGLPLIFSREEKNYLENKTAINMCVDPDWMPYEKIENHKHVGIVADYMKGFQEKIGVPLKLVETKNWSQSLEYVKIENVIF